MRERDNSLIPYVVTLRINEERRSCMIDTRGSYSLIKKSVIAKEHIDPQILESLCLRGITGHEIEIYGTTLAKIQTPFSETSS